MTQISQVYGQALYDLAVEKQNARQVLQQLQSLCAGFSAEPDFLRLLASPTVSKQERVEILEDSFGGKVEPYVLNFLKILTEKGYIRQFSGCCRAYEERYNKDNNILPVTAETATALTEEQQGRLTAKLCAITGKTVTLRNRINPDCLGGVRLDFDGKQVDDTVSHRLEQVRDRLKNAVL